jgi:hypothetical protein
LGNSSRLETGSGHPAMALMGFVVEGVLAALHALFPAVLEGGAAVRFVAAGPIAGLAVQAAAPTLATTVPRLQVNTRTSSPYNFSRPRRHSVRESLLA